MAGGTRRLVEFGDRNDNGASVFSTHDPKVAQAIRKHSMSRRGVIVETTPHQEEAPVIVAPKPQPRTLGVVKGVTKAPLDNRPNSTQKLTAGPAKKAEKPAEEKPAGNIREYANFTVAKEAICKEFQLAKSKVRNPTALDKIAAEKGFSIRYKSAEK